MKSSTPIRSYSKIARSFIVLTIILILVIGYFSLSRVKIIIYPAEEKVKVNFIAQIKEGLSQELDLEKIAGEILQTEVEQTQIFKVQNIKTFESRAEGEITIYNERDQTQILIATTRLLSPEGILFRLKNKVQIPPHSSTRAEVYADQKGARGNIEATTFSIPGFSKLLQKLVWAKSQAPMKGGIKEIGVVSEEEINQAKSKVASDLYQKAILELNKQITEEQDKETKKLKLLPKAIKKDIIYLETDVKPGDEQEEFEVKGKLLVTGVIFDEQDLFNLVSKKLEEQILDNQEIKKVLKDSFDYSLESFSLDQGSGLVSTYLEGIAKPKISLEEFDKDKLKGLNKKEVENYFSLFKEIKEIKVIFSPFWVRKVPRLKDHIEIIISDQTA